MIYVFIFFIVLFVSSSTQTFANYNPLNYPNNKIGIHILFPSELDKAKELINSHNGDWGYVTIPIQATDRDLKKWQSFMDACKKMHVIPLIRLATEGDYFTQGTWRIPTQNDVTDSANFLNSLDWPTKNRYVIIFNEVNRADEWGGEADPESYAKLLSYAVTVFKSKNQDFYIISSGMDNASITKNKTYNQMDYFTQMNTSIPGIFNQIDGIASHSYPNPGFIQDPGNSSAQNIDSFKYEKKHIQSLGGKNLPVFITETGWDQQKLSETKVIDYYKVALASVWNDPNIVAITPFLLNSGPGPFEKFSFIKNNGDKSDIFKMIQAYPKTRGKPIVIQTKIVLGEETGDSNMPVKDFTKDNNKTTGKVFKQLLKWTFSRF
jgi:hypothetical protein